MSGKILIYQMLPRLFGNANTTRKPNGTAAENGVGKLNDIDALRLQRIRDMGFTHVWFTGVLRHATTTDYSAYGLPRQHAQVVKGKAGSPYAIADYYDIDPDLAVDPAKRMDEFRALVKRTHEAGLKVIIDFVPNHVAREYRSVMRPAWVRDLGQDDDTGKHFSPQNNFYYCPGELFTPPVPPPDGEEPYVEKPAKCTGNDRFDSHPSSSDWYETVKLNYGVDYTDAGGRSYHFTPTPDTWRKMTDILLFWADQGVDGIRCDMAGMVPAEFWAFATQKVKEKHPDIVFIAEIYDTGQYSGYLQAGFDYLYDKVGMYDCLRDVICGRRPAANITRQWQATPGFCDHMLYFLENHDEQRLASDFFAHDPQKGLPATIVAALFGRNPFMLYSGQEVGEQGMDEEGFSGRDGRTTIFDYWQVPSVHNAYYDRRRLSTDQRQLMLKYASILRVARREKAVGEGENFDLMYVNPQTWKFNTKTEFAFLRKWQDEVLLVVANFSGEQLHTGVAIPDHAFSLWNMPEGDFRAIDLLSGDEATLPWHKNGTVDMELPPYGGRVYKFSIKMEDDTVTLNSHNKEEFPPAHTAEHLLNQLMVRMFGCERSKNAHIERKKSKISYHLDHKPTRQEEKAIETEMNRLISLDMPVTYEYVDRDHLPEGVSIDRLPDDASDTIRLVRIGDYDVCPCIGKHVRSTAQIGRFVLLGTNWDEMTHTFRIRFKVVP